MTPKTFQTPQGQVARYLPVTTATLVAIGKAIQATLQSPEDPGHETTSVSLGQVVDRLGVAADLPDGDLICDAVVLLKVLEPDGDTRLEMAWSPGLGWMELAGMLRVAERMTSTPAETG